MSYCREGEFESDVYVYRQSTEPTVIICHYGSHTFTAHSEEEMIEHLMLHRRRGHMVPERAFDRLYSELNGIPYLTDVEIALRQITDRS